MKRSDFMKLVAAGAGIFTPFSLTAKG